VRILIDIGHPAHVHYFRNLYFELIKRHAVIVTCKNLPIIASLLEHYKIPYTALGSKGKGVFGKLITQFVFTYKVFRILKQQHIDLAIGVSASIAQAGIFCRTKTILFDDDDLVVQPLSQWFVNPFANCIISPDTLKYEVQKNAVYYPGYQELAYLHPKRFAPDKSVLQKYGIAEGEKYFILRFNAFTAHHDLGKGGLSLAQKRELTGFIKQSGKVFISSERDIEPEFAQYKCPVDPHEMHSFLAFSALLVSDSQTMTSEATVLGVPSCRCNSFAGLISYLEEEEKKYGLTFAFQPDAFSSMLQKIHELLSFLDLREVWQQKRAVMLQDKIDVTAFWIWFMENYPSSVQQVRNPGFEFSVFR
jgi:predicted glycosyltransferase